MGNQVSSPTVPATDAPARKIRLAVATIGAVNVGIDVDAVRQAIPLSGALSALPRRQGALCGVAEHLGQLVPVVDLARWVDIGPAKADAADDDSMGRTRRPGGGAGRSRRR